MADKHYFFIRNTIMVNRFSETTKFYFKMPDRKLTVTYIFDLTDRFGFGLNSSVILSLEKITGAVFFFFFHRILNNTCITEGLCM